MRSIRSVSCALALSLVTALGAPVPARAGEDDTLNTEITIGALVVVVGILVWVGWKMDEEDRQLRAQPQRLLPLLADEDRALGVYLDDPVSGPEGDFDVSAGLAFRADF